MISWFVVECPYPLSNASEMSNMTKKPLYLSDIMSVEHLFEHVYMNVLAV